jgi:hypothetical protein
VAPVFPLALSFGAPIAFITSGRFEMASQTQEKQPLAGRARVVAAHFAGSAAKELGSAHIGGGIMRSFSKIIAFTLIFTFALASFATDFDKAQYFRKTDNGKKSDPVKGVVCVDPTAKEIRFVNHDGKVEFAVPAMKIKNIVYERTAKPRYAEGLLIAWPLLFTKSKSHYLTVQFENASGAGEYAIVKLDKSNYREVLATIEAHTGQKIQRSEES